jgi:hypothetical protein
VFTTARLPEEALAIRVDGAPSTHLFILALILSSTTPYLVSSTYFPSHDSIHTIYQTQ